MLKYLLYFISFFISVNLYSQHPELQDDETKETIVEQEKPNQYIESPSRHVILGIGYSQVSPLGKFKSNTDNIFHGLSSSVAWFIDRQNIAIGFFWNLHTYDFSEIYYDDYTENYTFGFDQLMTNIKFITNDGILQPYIEGFFGINWLYVDSRSHLSSMFYNLFESEEDSPTSSIDNSASLAYGVGAGFLLPFDFQNPNARGSYLEFSVKYTFSTNTSYYTSFNGDIYKESDTNNFTFGIAYVMIF